MLDRLSNSLENADWKRIASFSLGVSLLGVFLFADMTDDKQSFCQGVGVLFTLYGLKFL